jgi:hypothetical protein
MYFIFKNNILCNSYTTKLYSLKMVYLYNNCIIILFTKDFSGRPRNEIALKKSNISPVVHVNQKAVGLLLFFKHKKQKA